MVLLCRTHRRAVRRRLNDMALKPVNVFSIVDPEKLSNRKNVAAEPLGWTMRASPERAAESSPGRKPGVWLTKGRLSPGWGGRMVSLCVVFCRPLGASVSFRLAFPWLTQWARFCRPFSGPIRWRGFRNRSFLPPSGNGISSSLPSTSGIKVFQLRLPCPIGTCV
jgi:hypothetical protein